MSDKKVPWDKIIIILLQALLSFLCALLSGLVIQNLAALREITGNEKFFNVSYHILISLFIISYPILSFVNLTKLNTRFLRKIKSKPSEEKKIEEKSTNNIKVDETPLEEKNIENKEFYDIDLNQIKKIITLGYFGLWLGALTFLLIIFWKTDVGKINDPSIEITETFIAEGDQDEQITEETLKGSTSPPIVTETPTETPTPTPTPTITSTLTPTSTINPSVTPLMELDSLPDYWNVLPDNLYTYITPVPESRGVYFDNIIQINGIESGIRIDAQMPPNGVVGIFKSPNSDHITVKFTLEIEEIKVADVPSYKKIKVYFGFIDKDNFDVTDIQFMVSKNGSSDHSQLYFSGEEIVKNIKDGSQIDFVIDIYPEEPSDYNNSTNFTPTPSPYIFRALVTYDEETLPYEINNYSGNNYLYIGYSLEKNSELKINFNELKIIEIIN